MHKMTMEEIKKLLREEQIRGIVRNCTTFWVGNRISLNKRGGTWISDVGMIHVYKKSGWSRSTFKKRWEELISDGFIQRSHFNTCYGTVEDDNWRLKVAEMVYDELLKFGLSREMQSMELFPDLKEIQERVVLEVVNALTHMG